MKRVGIALASLWLLAMVILIVAANHSRVKSEQPKESQPPNYVSSSGEPTLTTDQIIEKYDDHKGEAEAAVREAKASLVSVEVIPNLNVPVNKNWCSVKPCGPPSFRRISGSCMVVENGTSYSIPLTGYAPIHKEFGTPDLISCAIQSQSTEFFKGNTYDLRIFRGKKLVAISTTAEEDYGVASAAANLR